MINDKLFNSFVEIIVKRECNEDIKCNDESIFMVNYIGYVGKKCSEIEVSEIIG